MSKTLFDITYELSNELKQTTRGTATGGSTTTILDSVERAVATEVDDLWNGGTAWILYDAGGAGAAPQGEYGYISDFANTGGVITLRTALTTAVASGDEYAIANLRYPLQVLIQNINAALGIIEKVDKTTVVIAADQTEYSLPSDVLELKQVWKQNNADTDDNDWQQLFDWTVEKSATGTANKLIFGRQFDTSDAVKLVYTTYPAKLQAATDKLDDSINIDKIVYNAVVGCLLWRKAKVGESDTTVDSLLNYYQALAGQKNQEFAMSLPRKSAKTIHPVFTRP